METSCGRPAVTDGTPALAATRQRQSARDVKAGATDFSRSLSLELERPSYMYSSEARSSRYSLDGSVQHRKREKETNRLPSGRLSADMRRASMESQTSTYSAVSTVTVPKGTAKGTCPRSHPLFSQSGTGSVKCSLCGYKTFATLYSCSSCNYHKCNCCVDGVKRPKEEKKTKAAKNVEKKPSCFAPAFSIFRSNPKARANITATAAPAETKDDSYSDH